MDKIIVKDIIGTSIAVLDKDGDPLYQYLKEKVFRKEKVELDLSELLSTSTAFFNYSIGQLYLVYDHDLIDQLLVFKNYTAIQRDQLDRVISNAKNYPFHRKLIKGAKELV